MVFFDSVSSSSKRLVLYLRYFGDKTIEIKTVCANFSKGKPYGRYHPIRINGTANIVIIKSLTSVVATSPIPKNRIHPIIAAGAIHKVCLVVK